MLAGPPAVYEELGFYEGGGMFRKRILILFVFLSGCATLSPKFETELQSNRVTYAMAGEGSVTLVLESGLGDGMDTWEPVFDPISSVATTFAYDRPGYGGSDDVSGTRTGRDIVEHLRTLLAQVELSPSNRLRLSIAS